MRSCSARSVSRRLVPHMCSTYEQGHAGLIGIDTRLGEQEVMQPDLLERARQ